MSSTERVEMCRGDFKPLRDAVTSTSPDDLFDRPTNAHGSQAYVRAGQRVFGGQQIGQEGSSGNSSGPHLHFEDPEPFMIGRGARLG
jgi:hypothetical protein